jgi:hypothetical protein
LIREEDIKPVEGLPSGVKWQAEWKIPRPPHDVHLVAIALGPGIDGPYWRMAKAYQPTSPSWEPHVIGCSGAVWLDVDGDSRATSARDYALAVFAKSGGDLPDLMERLKEFDVSVAIQAAALWHLAGHSLTDGVISRVETKAAPQVREGFAEYVRAWLETQTAQLEK